jgi:signal transduction histidine kinase
VSLLAVAVIAGWLVVLATAFDVLLFSRLDRQVDDTLRIRAQAASALVEIGHGAVLGLRESATDSAIDSSIWVYAGTRPIQRPHSRPDVLRAADRLTGQGRGYVSAARRRFYVLPLTSGGARVGTVIAALETAPYDDTKQLTVLGTIVVTVLLLAGAYPVLRLATGRALQPVASMTKQAADWSVTAPTQRFGSDQQHQELASLAMTLDQLLDRLAAVLRHERQVSAELSHELRTPLARIMTEVDLSLGETADRQRAGLAAIRETAVSMDQIIDTLLAAARTELVSVVGRSDLDPLLARFATDAGTPAVGAAPTGLSAGVDDNVITRILTPIVDNAVRYARRSVTLNAHQIDNQVIVTVVNDGPPIDPELAERIFEPGFRADLSDHHDGVGLGLALARRLARAVDGDLALDPAAEWTTFRLTLPAG